MNRRVFLGSLAGGLLAAPLAAGAQPAGKVYHLGMLIPGVRVAPSSPMAANVLPLVLRELGYVEGQNLVIERRFAEGKLDRLPGLARELVHLRMDVLVATSPLPVRAAKDATARLGALPQTETDHPDEDQLVKAVQRVLESPEPLKQTKRALIRGRTKNSRPPRAPRRRGAQ